MATDIKKLSFAKVAASASAKEKSSLAQSPRVAVPIMERRNPHPSSGASPAISNNVNNIRDASVAPAVANDYENKNIVLAAKNGSKEVDGKVLDGLKDLNLSTATDTALSSTPSLVVNGSSSSFGGSPQKNESKEALSDDVSQRADSSSELGTKPPSLDGKSITSGTTFALDEKESLRPDDSASVKAAAEDDDTFSNRGSLIAGSRIGSDVAGARVHRIRLGDMPERRIVQIVSENRGQGVHTPLSVSSGPQPVPDVAANVLAAPAGSVDALNEIYGKTPDEKLLEAMQSPKDRIFLLRLEQDVINFVQSSKEPFMDLPPNNSFCRMLTHRLADYYHMTHSFDAVAGGVRIYRTPFCRVPPPLASLAATAPIDDTPPPVLLPKKIMRRGEENGSSASPSKATSEDGSDGKDKAATKEKLTREEREEAYNRARERIFGTADKTGESTPDNEDSTGMSRASSVSAKDKSNVGRRGKSGKQRRDDSESFDSRSQYTPYYGHLQQPTWTSQYMPAGPAQYNEQYSQQMQLPYPTSIPTGYGPPAQGYPQMMPNNGFPQYNPMPGYPQPQAQQPHYPPPTGQPMGGYGPPMPPASQQPWQPPYAASPMSYQPPRGPAPQQGSPSLSSVGIPYAFGQLPANMNPKDPKSQHPIPGSYNRNGFNPKTQSFIPNNGGKPVQQSPVPYHVGLSGSHGSPQISSPHLAYNGFQPPPIPMPQQPYGTGFGMVRQGSNNSIPPYPPQAPHMHLPQMPLHHKVSQKSGLSQGQHQQSPGTSQTFSHLPTYGNPATLPQKPPTGI